MKIVNVKKFIVSILFILGMIVFISLCITSTTLSHGETEYKTIYVSNGDTLWSIAKREISENEYYVKKDVRDVVENLKSVNHLSNTSLKIGHHCKSLSFNTK